MTAYLATQQLLAPTFGLIQHVEELQWQADEDQIKEFSALKETANFLGMKIQSNLDLFLLKLEAF
jgi:hypothetical protein